jgi:hypothetical protein
VGCGMRAGTRSARVRRAVYLVHRSRTLSVRWRKKAMTVPRSVSYSLRPTDDFPRRDADASCTICGCKGTWAWIAQGRDPRRVSRYCRRCWPAAQRASEAALQRAALEAQTAHQEWFRRWKVDRTLPEPPDPDLGDRAMGWHWSLALGTFWRMIQAERNIARTSRRSWSAT